MGVFEAIKKGFSVATKNMALVLILIIFNIIFNMASIPLAIKPGTTPTPQATITALVFSIVFVLISILIQGGSLGLVRDYIKEGKMETGKLISYGMKYYLRLLGLGILIILIVAIIALIAGLIVAITAPLNNAVISTIAVVAAVVIAVIAGLWFFIPLALSPYALVCDESGVIASMKKSLDVGRNPFSRVFVLLLLFIVLILIALGIGLVIGFLIGLLSAVLPATIGQVVMGIGTSVINGYLGIVMMAAFMAFYLGLSAKKA